MAGRGRPKGVKKTPGSGRAKGTPNKFSLAKKRAKEKAAKKIEAVIDDAYPHNAHALLVAVYKDPKNDLPIRLDAAKAAIGYEVPRLTAVDMKANVTVKSHEEALAELQLLAEASHG